MSTFEVDTLFSVKGKVALVTGGSRGVGKMVTDSLLGNSKRLSFLKLINLLARLQLRSSGMARRTVDECGETAKELSLLGPGKCIALPADLQKYEGVEFVVKELASKESALHILVNNAGAAWGSPIDDFPDAAFTKVVTLNLQRVFTLTQKLLPLLRAAALSTKNEDTYDDPARIINIGSVEGLSVPDHETYAYSASKAALHHLSRHLGGRLGWEGITSNTIALTAHTLATAGGPLLAATPAQRFGKPEDIGGAVLYLASPAGAWVNGATIRLDGGLLLTGKELKRQALKHMSGSKL
ncbi:hypothetical protein H0H92_003516 [Tricholoma furcatifolium]|nr:hypothetical protein H0H92_003516 [Tricholoma furcatifolium]